VHYKFFDYWVQPTEMVNNKSFMVMPGSIFKDRNII